MTDTATTTPTPAPVLPDARAGLNDPQLRAIKCLRAAQLAELLGVDRSTVHRLTQRAHNPLPCIHVSRRLTVFVLSEVATWVKEQGR